MSNEEKRQLLLVLQKNIDVFAWSHSDMVGIDLIVAFHKLSFISAALPVRQKVRRFHLDRHQII